MLIAQGLGEYGALSGGFASSLEAARVVIEDQIRQTEPLTWLVMLAGAAFVWFVFFRAR
jgi:hypothetical protein